VTDLPAGTSKLIQYLNEAYGTERRLQIALQAHLGLASRATYKNRLREHLSETKRHAREVSSRIKRLGGTAETIDVPGPDALAEVAQMAVAGAQRAAAFAQAPMHALRGTSKEEKQLKNAKTEYASEAEEIATYTAIVAVAEALGDSETVKLARSILREEERMRSFLEKEIPRMAAAVVSAEVPRSQRPSGARSRRRSPRTTASARRGASSRSRAPASKSARRTSARRTSTARPSAPRQASRRSGSSRQTSRRSGSRGVATASRA
jgi:ferritin-like metal-binding protein YciE